MYIVMTSQKGERERERAIDDDSGGSAGGV